MLNHNGSGQVPISLLQGRLGIYNKNSFDPDEHTLDGVDH
jgi:hypothetical protein